jgi:polysaccharide pyruvyl transferase WcaK-like protein
MEPMPATNPTGASMPKVALAGFYGSGNFGDDLSASLFGLAMQRLGIPFSLYGLCEPYVARFGFDRAATIEELLHTAGAFVWGGGGLLISWSRLTYRVLYPSAASSLDRLVRAVLERDMPVLLSSIGGDGRPLTTLTPAYRARLVKAARSLTVRNPQDVALLEAVGQRAQYFPDIVWGLSRVLPMARRRSARPRLGIDLYPSNLLRQGALRLLPLLQAAVNARPECDFVFIDTTNASCRRYRGLGGIIRGPNVSRYQFRDLDEDLAFVASLDAVFSSRLHMPVVAMQYGVPALSVFAEPKTRMLFANLGLERYSFHRDRISELGFLMAGRTAFDRLVAEFAFPDADRLADESQGHVACLEEALSHAVDHRPAALRAEPPR